MAKKRYTVRLANGRTLTTSNPAAWASRTGVTVEGWGGGSGGTERTGGGHPGGTDSQRTTTRKPKKTTTTTTTSDSADRKWTQRGGKETAAKQQDQTTKAAPKPQPKPKPKVDTAALIEAVKAAAASDEERVRKANTAKSSTNRRVNPADSLVVTPKDVRLMELTAQRDHDNELAAQQQYALRTDIERQAKANVQNPGQRMNPAQAAAMYGGTPGITPWEQQHAGNYEAPSLVGLSDQVLDWIATQQTTTPFDQTEAAAGGTAPGAAGTIYEQVPTDPDDEEPDDEDPRDPDDEDPDDEDPRDPEDEDIIQQIAQILFGGGGGGGGMPELSGGPGLPGRLGNPLEQFTNADLIAPEVLRLLRNRLPQLAQPYGDDLAWLNNLSDSPMWDPTTSRYI